MNAVPLSKALVLCLHCRQIQLFGGLDGLSNDAMLDSALTQPFATFDGVDLYPAIEEKAARYAFGIIKNHPFADGNKRTGAVAMVAFLKVNGYRFKPKHDVFEKTILDVASGELDFEELVEFVRQEASPDAG